MPPTPNEGDYLLIINYQLILIIIQGDKIPPVQMVSKEPVDIENLLKLNPKIKPYANAVPSAVTKKVRLELTSGLIENKSFDIPFSFWAAV